MTAVDELYSNCENSRRIIEIVMNVNYRNELVAMLGCTEGGNNKTA